MASDVMHGKTIAVFYFHCASNIGDLAINEGVLNLIDAVAPNSSLKFYLLDAEKSVHLESSVLLTNARHEYHFIEGRDINPFAVLDGAISAKSVFKGLSDCDLILLNSGEHYFQYAHRENSYSLLWRMMPALISFRLKIPVVMLPSTIGPLETRGSRELVEELSRHTEAVFVRDSASKSYIEEQLSFVKKPYLTLDPAFYLNRFGIDKTIKGVSKTPKKIALAVRSEDWGIRLASKKRAQSNAMHTENNYESSLSYQYAERVISNCLEFTNCEVIVYIQTLADKKLANRIKQEFSNESRVIIEYPKSVTSYLESLKSVDVIVASRFHAIIMGIISDCYPIGVYFENHGHKMPGLFQALNISDNVMLLCENTLDSVVEQTISLLSRDDSSFKSALYECVGDYKKQFLNQMSQILFKADRVPVLLGSELESILRNLSFDATLVDVALKLVKSPDPTMIELSSRLDCLINELNARDLSMFKGSSSIGDFVVPNFKS